MSSEKTTNGRALPTWMRAVDRRPARVDADPPRVARLERAGARPCGCRGARSRASCGRSAPGYPLRAASDGAGAPRADLYGLPRRVSGDAKSRTRRLALVDARVPAPAGPLPRRASRASTRPTTCALGDLGHTWEVRATDARRARPQGRHAAARPTSRSAPTRAPGCACARATSRASRPSRQRRLYVRGNLDLAVGFEGLFRLPQRARAAAARPRRRRRAPAHLDADDGRGPRRRCCSTASAPPRRRSSTPRRRSRAPATASTPRPARLRLLDQAGARALRRAAASPTRCSA